MRKAVALGYAVSVATWLGACSSSSSSGAPAADPCSGTDLAFTWDNGCNAPTFAKDQATLNFGAHQQCSYAGDTPPDGVGGLGSHGCRYDCGSDTLWVGFSGTSINSQDGGGFELTCNKAALVSSGSTTPMCVGCWAFN